MGTKLSFLVGFVSGITAGWLLGILSAPQSGKETRADIVDAAGGWVEKAEETAGRLREGVLGNLESTTHLDADYTR